VVVGDAQSIEQTLDRIAQEDELHVLTAQPCPSGQPISDRGGDITDRSAGQLSASR
jgi:hypothetical protein